jgi:hypothetical protein
LGILTLRNADDGEMLKSSGRTIVGNHAGIGST